MIFTGVNRCINIFLSFIRLATGLSIPMKLNNFVQFRWLNLLFLMCLVITLAPQVRAMNETVVNLGDRDIPETDKVPGMQHVLTLVVTVDELVEVGESNKGIRKYVPITGGYFAGQHVNGESLSGDVIPGGADWQLKRPDGVLEIDALYSIRTSDGQTIIIHNSGIASQADERGPYVRTIPKFQAPKGRYDWLNQHVFTGTIDLVKGGGAVIIRVFQVL